MFKGVIIIAKTKKDKNGSIYYDKKDKKWKCSYYIFNQEGNQEKRKYKSFSTQKEAQDFLTSIQYQKGNDLFIKNNGIPLNQLMRENAQKKLNRSIDINYRLWYDCGGGEKYGIYDYKRSS